MTHYSDRRQTPWLGKLIVSVFLLVLGGMANQFWNIPQQDYRMRAIEGRMNEIDKHLQANDQRLDEFVRQHAVIERQLDELQKLHHERQK